MGTATSIERAERALRAGQRARIVQHASLRPAREDDAAQMKFAVEDALNTADFADCGRLIVVRQLRLANVPPRASAAWMARAMESAWRAMATQAVPGGHASAASAQAVYFASRFEARLDWLERVASGRPVDAWFWAAALPELKAAAEEARALDAVLGAMWRESGPAFVAALKTWPDAVLVSLARVLPGALHRTMLATLTRGVPTVGMPTTSAKRVTAARALPASMLPVAERLSREAPLAEEAASWVAALWLAHLSMGPPTLEDVQAVVTRAVWLAAGVVQVAVPAAASECDRLTPAVPGVAQGHAQPAGVESSARVVALSDSAAPMNVRVVAPHPTAPAAASSWRIESGLHAAPQPPAREVAARRESPRSLPWLADAAFTSHGGLMLVLNVLRAMRFDSPSVEFVEALMLHLLDAVGAPEDEPQRAWFGVRGVHSPGRDGDFDRLSPTLRYLRASGTGASIPQPERQKTQPERQKTQPERQETQPERQEKQSPSLENPFGLRYRSPRGGHPSPFGLSLSKSPSETLAQQVHQPHGRPDPDLQLKLWRLRIRRILRRHLLLDLHDLIHRPAWVSASDTHIDVVYPMSGIDLRLRRRGLDADPGWVPWFGRIVTFQFIDDELLPSSEAAHG